MNSVTNNDTKNCSGDFLDDMPNIKNLDPIFFEFVYWLS